jgi:hypothetical protein
MTLDTICPELMQLKGSDQLNVPGGNVFNWDTTIIQNNYFIVDDDELEEGENKDRDDEHAIDRFKYSIGDNHMYRATKVKATYYINFDYGDVDLYIFHFVECTMDGEVIITEIAKTSTE